MRSKNRSKLRRLALFLSCVLYLNAATAPGLATDAWQDDELPTDTVDLDESAAAETLSQEPDPVLTPEPEQDPTPPEPSAADPPSLLPTDEDDEVSPDEASPDEILPDEGASADPAIEPEDTLEEAPESDPALGQETDCRLLTETTATGIMVTVEGMLPENVLLVASEPAGYEPELQDGETLLFAVDITLYGEGEVYQPESPIAVSLTLPEELLEDLPADGEITVYHDHADETTRLADVQPDDAGTVAFETDGFSVFYGTAAVQADEEKTLPNGGTLSSGTYILSGGMTLTNTLTIASGENVTIDLKGYTLTSALGVFSLGNNLIIVKSGATLTIKNGTVAGQTLTSNSAINNAGALNVENVIFSQCTATLSNGGAISSTGVLNISGGTFENCSAAEGGAIYSTGELTTSGSTFKGCSAAEGGAIYSTGELTTSGSTFKGCSATEGGAIYSTGELTTSGSTFEGCSALEGGAISASGTITIENTSFATCKATGQYVWKDGGGACEFSAPSGETTVKMNGVTFTECTAANNNGNAISMGSGTTLNAQNVSVTGCGSTDTAIHGSISGQVTVRPTVEPTFTITIPETLPVGDTTGVQISAQLTDFSDTQYVSVTVKSSGGFSLAQEGSNASLAYTLFSGSQAITNGGTVATFKAADQGAQTLTAKLNDASDVKYAGTYTDTLTFTVTLHDE